jgi:hypothetical protein
MTQEHSPDTQTIRCEAITDEIVTSCAKQGFVLDFAEEVMRFDLSLAFAYFLCFPWEAVSKEMC